MTSFKYLATLALVLSVFNITVLNAQDAVEPNPLKNGSIKAQFEHVMNKSNRYKNNKVVKEHWLQTLKSNTLDSLKTLATTIKSSNQQIEKQQNTIKKLEESLSKINTNLETVTQEKDNMVFLGMAFSKQSYKTMMWAIVGVLVLLLGFFIFKFKNSNSITVQSKKALADIEAEFEDHRRRALEREQKVMRKLQDEINKQKKSNS